MLKEVEAKIQELHALQKDEYYRQKNIDLESWGLSQRQGSKNAVPLIVTDDEYEAIIEASTGLNGNSRNYISTILNVASYAVVTLGIILGIVLMINAEELGFIYLSASMFVSFIIAILFKGLSEAIKLLQQLIDQKRVEEFRKMHEQKQIFPDEQPEVAPFKNAPPVRYAYPADKKTVDMPE